MVSFESSSQCVCAAGSGFELLSRASDQRWDELWVEKAARNRRRNSGHSCLQMIGP